MLRDARQLLPVLGLSSILNGQVNADSIATLAMRHEDSSRVKIERLSVNSHHSDFSPFVADNKFYFVSDRPNKVAVQYVNEAGNNGISDIYVSGISGDKIRKERSFGPPVNTKFNEGPLCFSGDRKKLYFTSNDDRSPLLKIKQSTRSGGSWQKPAILPFCDQQFSYCHPALSDSGDILVFSSNCAGAIGGMDLFMSVDSAGTWSIPKSLGSRINSEANEVFPFIRKNILYFASNRGGGSGGFDIYQVLLNDTSSHPEKLPPPLNSEFDDFGIYLDSSLQSGYLSSNRKKEFKDDIYRFNTFVPDFSSARTQTVKSTFCYSFYEESTLVNNDSINMEYEWNFGDGKKARGLRAKHCYDKPGIYGVSLSVVEKVSGEVFTSMVNYDLEVATPEKLYISCSDTTHTGESLVISGIGSAVKGGSIEQLYWSFGDGWYNYGPAVKHVYQKAGEYDLELLATVTTKSGKSDKVKTVKRIVVKDKKN